MLLRHWWATNPTSIVVLVTAASLRVVAVAPAAAALEEQEGSKLPIELLPPPRSSSAPAATATTTTTGPSCGFAVDAGTGRGFQKGVLRGGEYFRWATPSTNPAAVASVAGCAALCCATHTCRAFSLNAPWSLGSTPGVCEQGQNCCCLASSVIGPMLNNTYPMNITSGVVQAPPPQNCSEWTQTVGGFYEPEPTNKTRYEPLSIAQELVKRA